VLIYFSPKYFKETDIGYVANPDLHSARKLSKQGDIIYDVHYSIDNDGFRLTKLTNNEQPHRINFFGCSMTFGEGMNDEETLPYFVQKNLQEVKVKNFGWHGYGAHQALAILQSSRDTRGDINFSLRCRGMHRDQLVSTHGQAAPRDMNWVRMEHLSTPVDVLFLCAQLRTWDFLKKLSITLVYIN
jgi:hypothetical protein